MPPERIGGIAQREKNMKKLGYIKGQRVDFKDGFIVVPPFPTTMNLAEPDVYAESLAPLYPIGTLAWFPGIGKKYRYSKAGTALVGTKTLAINGNRPPTSSSYPDRDGFYGNVATVHEAGAREITFADTIDRVKDYYAGAHLLIFDADRNVCFEDSYIVSGPPAPTEDPWSTTVTLLKAKKYKIFANDGIQIWLNPYSNICKHDLLTAPLSQFQTCMGVPPIPVQNGWHFWLQTAGPVFITPNSWAELCPGWALNSRRVWVHQHGGIITCTDAAGVGDQVIGVLMSLTEDGSADAWVNMDLDLGH